LATFGYGKAWGGLVPGDSSMPVRVGEKRKERRMDRSPLEKRRVGREKVPLRGCRTTGEEIPLRRNDGYRKRADGVDFASKEAIRE